MAKEPVNGRQIKNIVRMAYAHAANAKRKIEPADVTIGLVAHRDFEVEHSEAKALKETNRSPVSRWSLLISSFANGMSWYNLVVLALVVLLLWRELGIVEIVSSLVHRK